MARIRQVNEVAILEFDGDALTDLMAALRAHVDDESASNGRTVLVDLRDLQELSADGIETLTEAAIVCRDRGCDIGMFSLHEDVWRLLDALELGPHLPRVLQGDESAALAQLEEEAAVPPVAAAPALPEAPPPPAIDIDLSFDAATAPTARFGPIPKGPEAYAEQPPQDLLRINWADLVQTGYQINGENAAAIHAAVAAESAVPTPEAEEAYSPLDTGDMDRPPLAVSRAAAEPPTRPMVMSMPEAEPEAPPAPVVAPQPVQPAAQQPHPAVTAYAEDVGEGEDQTVMFQPGADFAAQLAAQLAASEGQAAQPNAALRAELTQASQDLERSQSREVPPEVLASAQAPAGAFVAPEESDEGNQTVMFQPGLDLAAELARLEAADAARAAADTAETERTHSPAYARDAEDDQTVMFQPGALDAALLAEVAAAVGPEQVAAPPPTQTPPPAAQVRQVTLGLNGDDAELRVFLHDYALQTPLHLELLTRFALAGERALGPADLRAAGNSGGRVTDVVDQFVQCRLVRRTRAPRVRGGTGFVFSPSPRVSGLVKKLIKLWQAPQSRATVSSWFDT
ncbi:MAG: STAS domain-containing protein [Planctomycetes bacterium]|nr:STAS domain-containing protein [Planctomycetota bacterium]